MFNNAYSTSLSILKEINKKTSIIYKNLLSGVLYTNNSDNSKQDKANNTTSSQTEKSLLSHLDNLSLENKVLKSTASYLDQAIQTSTSKLDILSGKIDECISKSDNSELMVRMFNIETSILDLKTKINFYMSVIFLFCFTFVILSFIHMSYIIDNKKLNRNRSSMRYRYTN